MTDLATSTIIPRWSRPVTFEYEGGQARLSPVFEDLDFRGHTSGLGPVVGQNRLLIDGSVQWKGWIADSMNEPTVARPLIPGCSHSACGWDRSSGTTMCLTRNRAGGVTMWRVALMSCH